MPFLRIVRDKRGYEYFSLIQQTSGRRGKVRQQLLYWFRTPPNIKVGRQALDEDVIRALEARNPDVRFDWDELRDTPPLAPPVETWRERRLAERAARQRRDAEDVTEATGVESDAAAAEVRIDTVDAPVGESRADSLVVETVPPAASTDAVPAADISVDSAAAWETAVAAPSGSVRRRRHRRRGRRGPVEAASPATVQAEAPASSSTGRERPRSPDEEQ
jgi:hypothetical protein